MVIRLIKLDGTYEDVDPRFPFDSDNPQGTVSITESGIVFYYSTTDLTNNIALYIQKSPCAKHACCKCE